jgi:DNA polymerase-1
MSLVLAIDVSNMAHRAMHTTGGLAFDGDYTGIMYGIFRDIVSFVELFNSDMIAFCFDGGCDKRWEIYSDYKGNRKVNRREMDEDERETRRELSRQIYRLRTSALDEVGFRNVFWQEGYEADDIIAWLCENHTHDFVIVSTDHDLYQCLSTDRVTMWNPITKRATTQESFEERFGIDPALWAHVKAIAGCAGDAVPGIRGVGEKIAAKYVSGKLKSDSKAFRSIIPESSLVKRNLQLVRLPFPGCGPFELNADDVTRRSWDKMMESMGMRSLVGRR